MPSYDIKWAAYGVARIMADDPQSAMEIISDTLFDLDPSDDGWVDNSVDGVDYEIDRVVE